MAPRAGDRLLLVGATRGHLGRSALLAELLGREEGEAPPVDLAAERAAGEFVLAANAEGLVGAAHDLSDGGLAVAAAEMALAGNVGVEIGADPGIGSNGWFFGEDQGRYLLGLPRRRRSGGSWRWRRRRGCRCRRWARCTARRCGSGDDEVGLAELRRAHAGCLAELFD